MEKSRFTVVSEAPLDAHTHALLSNLTPAQVVVADATDPASTLRDWAAAATAVSAPLVLADSTVRAEANALANLLDDPRVHTGVLMAHNPIEGVNSEVLVDDDGYLADEGVAAQTAGIMLVAAGDCPAFADALLAAADGARTAGTHPWDLALAALMSTRRVRAVAADPFCASREGMEIPTRSEHDRRLRAAASPSDDLTARVMIRPASRRLTNWAVTRGVPSARLTWLGLGTGAAAAALAVGAGVTGLPAPLLLILAALSGLALVVSGLFFLASGESVRYLRRPSVSGQRHYAWSRRLVDIAFLVALGLAAAPTGPSGATIAAVALASVGVSASLSASYISVTGATSSEHWPLRWLLTAIAFVVGGPVWALIAAAAVAVGSTVFLLVESVGRSAPQVFAVTKAQRFLTSPGVLVDAGIPVRLLSTIKLPIPALAPGPAVIAAMAALIAGAAASWGQRPWALLFGSAVAVVLLSMALRTPLQGRWAWLVPPVARVAEFVVIVAVGSFLGGIAVALLIAAAVLLTGETTDRWRLRRRPPLPWVPVTGLGFDGRLLAVVTAVALLPSAAPLLVGVIAGIVALTWIAAAASFWRPTNG